MLFCSELTFTITGKAYPFLTADHIVVLSYNLFKKFPMDSHPSARGQWRLLAI